jgi:hypothetical protein
LELDESEEDSGNEDCDQEEEIKEELKRKKE